MKNTFLFLLTIMGLTAKVGAQNNDFPKPTLSQMAWHEAEIGALISYDLHVFDGKITTRPTIVSRPLRTSMFLIRLN